MDSPGESFLCIHNLHSFASIIVLGYSIRFRIQFPTKFHFTSSIFIFLNYIQKSQFRICISFHLNLDAIFSKFWLKLLKISVLTGILVFFFPKEYESIAFSFVIFDNQPCEKCLEPVLDQYYWSSRELCRIGGILFKMKVQINIAIYLPTLLKQMLMHQYELCGTNRTL